MNRASILLLATLAAFAQGHAQKNKEASLVARVGDTGFVTVAAGSFQKLSPKQKALAYWLTRASIAIDPIIYDQLSAFGLREKRLLEEIVAHPEGVDPRRMKEIRDFTELFWANRGNHDTDTSQKFLPAFTFDELRKAAEIARQHGAMANFYADLKPITTLAELQSELEDLHKPLFDPLFQPMTTAKSPQGGLDIIQASSNTYYLGASLDDLKGFHEEHRLNSRVVKGGDGQLREVVYRAGTPDGKIPPGLYSIYLKKANEYLAKAEALADPVQAQVIGDLIRYYQTGDFNDWLKFDADWVRNNATVDFVNGFIDIYRDARGDKGDSQSFVSVTDKALSRQMELLAANAAYFEQKAPWDRQYKKTTFSPPVVKAIKTLIETGDFNVGVSGDNLPNENEIHERYGTKNFLFTSSTHASYSALASATAKEFSSSSEEIVRQEKYGEDALNLETALHEVIGHGSGRLSPRLRDGAESALKEYFSTLEEARADLMALWNVWDPRLKKLGLIGDQDEMAKTMYDLTVRSSLTQLRLVPNGETLEEDHARDRQLIAGYIMDKTGGIEQFKRDGKTYIRVSDYQKARQGVGMLLAELMRIKAEGDYDAIKALVDNYGVRFDPALRDEVMVRYKRLDLPTNLSGINSELTAQFDAKQEIEKVEISYPLDPVQQYLGYAAMYDNGLTAMQGEHGHSKLSPR
jgi:dipeptidyl-peptidase III